ncbi:transmembrane protein 53 [Onthophagus taurus]|uniref:transmembrane protein 53 n=1 Tax=Onthophagus taurus TaxID=166361 RepID=UPI0039BDAB43
MRAHFKRRNMAELDNLEYYIKFPNPNYNYTQTTNGDSDFVFVIDENKVPVILLFGWAGCQDKYLSKYSQIYEERGLITLRYTAPVKCLFWKRYQMIQIGQKIVKLLIDLNFESHPIVVHCFSNGGAFLYQNFSSALSKSPKPLQIKGVIVDSAPGKRRLGSLYRAISNIIGGTFWYNLPMSILITIVCSIMWIYEILSSLLKPGCSIQSDPFEILKKEKNTWPQHFIYSKADVLIPYQDIEYFADYRENVGVNVTRLCYEDSPHVKHYTHNKESYVNSVCNFINKCLSNGRN